MKRQGRLLFYAVAFAVVGLLMNLTIATVVFGALAVGLLSGWLVASKEFARPISPGHLPSPKQEMHNRLIVVYWLSTLFLIIVIVIRSGPDAAMQVFIGAFVCFIGHMVGTARN